MFGFNGCCERPLHERVLYGQRRLFNWLTILLVTLWVLFIAVLAETTEQRGEHKQESAQVFFKELIN